MEWDLQRTYNGFATEVERPYTLQGIKVINDYIAPAALLEIWMSMIRGLHPRLCYFAFSRLFYRASEIFF